MNIYILLRVILHSLLSVTNLLALTAAAWSIAVSKGDDQPHASPGAVLVVVGTIAYIVLGLITWAECCLPGTLMSRVRTELALIPMLIVFQLIAAAVATSNAVESVCHDFTSCVTLLVLSWIAVFSLIMYYLVVLAVTFDHARTEPGIWDASFLQHPWFLRPPPLAKETAVPLRRFSIPAPLFPLAEPSIVDHRRQRSSWMPSPSGQSVTLPEPIATQRLSQYSTRSSVKSLVLPKWASDLRPLRRGVEPPFPVQTREQARRWGDPRRIDAPVSPSLYTEYS